ncbi:hypothetical protein LSCM1_03376 [Leishmania martiniquensis]|uniref:Uncharacterized protein n=1 Tax=Leishmania martiniquensis TaxID=1580590 RepID=A0A836KLS3_9TRYP|nr:hypothetical protein LSCM1_03376 [Leishmania martiniquensis]
MRRCIRFVCACTGRAMCSSALPPALVEASTTSTARLYQQCLSPTTSPGDVSRFTAALLLAIDRGELTLREQVELLRTLAARSIRNEDAMLRCLWAVFKASLPVDEDTSGEACTTMRCASLSELSELTSTAFQVMAEQRFLNDPQMTAVALGRCVELIPYACWDGLRSTYCGLRAVNHMFFSVAEVEHHSSEVTGQMTAKEFYETADAPDEETLRHQPNLLDVLCGEMELRLRCLCDAITRAAPGPFETTNALSVPSARGASINTSAAREAHGEQWLLDVLSALAVVGVLHASTLDSLTALMIRCRAESSVGFFIKALTHATRIEERVVDPLTYEESAAVRDARRRLTLHLSEAVQKARNIHGYLQHHPQELLLLRRLFERDAAEPLLSLALWDTVRTIRVAHRHTIAASQASHRPSGALFRKMYDVKVKPISVNNAETERFVPPAFKTWRSPAASPRGGHHRHGCSPARTAFGTRRISKNYIKNKRKKFCPAVF